MKLAAVYNVYDGIENLGESITSIKDNVDEVIIIYGKYQDHKGEIAKRQKGVDRAKELGCTHVILMDCDEVYDPIEFKQAKDLFIKTNLSYSVCLLDTYYKTKEYKFAKQEAYFVPFIQKTGQLELSAKWNYLCDPTRKMKTGNKEVVMLPITMKHYSHIRESEESYKAKLLNSSAYKNYSHRVDIILKDWCNFTGDLTKPVNIAGKGDRVEWLTKAYEDNKH